MCTLCFPALSRRRVLRLTAAFCGAAVFGRLPATAAAQTGGAPNLPKEIVGVRIPDSDLARGAAMLAQMESPQFLFNHCMRTFVLASLFAKTQGWKYDEELVFVASALHDLGLLEKFDDPYKTFQHSGADYAETFVLKGGFTEDRAERVFKSILWHAGEVANTEVPDILWVQTGAGMDVFGRPYVADMPQDQFQGVLAALPRLAFKQAFLALMTAHVARSRHPGFTKGFTEHPPKNFLTNRWPE